MDRSTLLKLLYALACVVVPVAWGLIVVRLSNAVERRVRARNGKEIPPIEYHI